MTYRSTDKAHTSSAKFRMTSWGTPSTITLALAAAHCARVSVDFPSTHSAFVGIANCTVIDFRVVLKEKEREFEGEPEETLDLIDIIWDEISSANASKWALSSEIPGVDGEENGENGANDSFNGEDRKEL